MEEIIVQGGNRLEGTVKVEGAKNAVLPILAAAILAETGKVHLKNVPILSDVHTMNELLNNLNVFNTFDKENNEMHIDATGEVSTKADYDFVSIMRASIVVMGPMLARYGHAKVAMPGGCAIGTRPIDLHLKGFEAMGAEITSTAGYVEAKVDKLKGARIYLDFPSVGATQNIMMAAVLAEGITTLENVAREPEIVDLANFLNKMGAKVVGAGTETIKITGVKALHGAEHSVIPDRIEAGTFVIMAAACADRMEILNVIPKHIESLTMKLQEMGVKMDIGVDSIVVYHTDHLKGVEIVTKPYPGFATDLQQPITPLLTQVEDDSRITDTIYKERFKHCLELQRMGADIEIGDGTCLIHGKSQLYGDKVTATDLRCGASLIIAGLLADGVTEIHEVHHIDRGYDNIDGKLLALGAKITREWVED